MATGILISGPPRCGKTTAATHLRQAAPKRIAVMTVDALLLAMRREDAPSTLQARKDFTTHYLTRPRFIDAAKSQSRRPVDDFGCDLTAVASEAARSEAYGALQLANAALRASAEASDCDCWVAPDLHAEFVFADLAASSSDVALVTVLRDPREAIAAALYWRTFPDRASGGRRILRSRLLHWCLSADVAARLHTAFPVQAFVQRLRSRDRGLDGAAWPGFQAVGDAITAAGADPMHFDRDVSRGWLCPDGAWRALLSDAELHLIETLAHPWFDPAWDAGGERSTGVACRAKALFWKAVLNLLLGVSRADASLAKRSVDWLFSPGAEVRRLLRSGIERVSGHILKLRRRRV